MRWVMVVVLMASFPTCGYSNRACDAAKTCECPIAGAGATIVTCTGGGCTLVCAGLGDCELNGCPDDSCDLVCNSIGTCLQG